MASSSVMLDLFCSAVQKGAYLCVKNIEAVYRFSGREKKKLCQATFNELIKLNL